MPDQIPTCKKPERIGPPPSKVAFLAGLPRSVRDRIEVAYEARALGYGVRLSRDTRPDGSSRRGEFPEWIYRLLEASFAVEDEMDHEQGNTPPSKRHVVNELNRRRNLWLDEIGENESRAAIVRAGRKSARVSESTYSEARS
jgi:hypothetical protein